MSKKRSFEQKILFLFLLLIVLLGFHAPVRAAEKCKVTFANANGVVSNDAYRKLAQTVEKGTSIILPVSNATGKKSYWAIVTPSGKKYYNMNTAYTVTEDVTFCLFRYPLYTIRFFDGDKEYTSHRLQRTEIEAFTFPSIKSTELKIGLGFTTVKGSMNVEYTPGMKLKVKKNMDFYVVWQEKRVVNFCYCDGSVYKKVTLNKGETMKFPDLVSKKGTILGWSQKPNQHTNPSFFAGEDIPLLGNNYYMVEYEASSEVLLKASQLEQPFLYGHVYVVGDSRTHHTQILLSKYTPNVSYIAKTGMGLAWFKGQTGEAGGYELLINELKKQGKASKRSAIVFNLGGNDMYNVFEYIEYMNEIAPVLKSYNCDLFFMSVNPVSYAMRKVYYAAHPEVLPQQRTESHVTSFNRIMKGGLNSKYYKYLDTCTNLRNNGWISMMVDGIYDGLHYSTPTYEKIYNLMIKTIENYYFSTT